MATSWIARASLVDGFCPTVRDWFLERFGAPTDAQAAEWPSILSGRDTLLAAPTGSGKTLAAFMAGIDRLVREAEAGDLETATSIGYVSPLKALSNDFQRNLEDPLEGSRRRAIAEGREPPAIRTGLRTGDNRLRDSSDQRPESIGSRYGRTLLPYQESIRLTGLTDLSATIASERSLDYANT